VEILGRRIEVKEGRIFLYRNPGDPEEPTKIAAIMQAYFQNPDFLAVHESVFPYGSASYAGDWSEEMLEAYLDIRVDFEENV